MKKGNEILAVILLSLAAVLLAAIGLRSYDTYVINRQAEQERREQEEVLARNREANDRVLEMRREIQELSGDREMLSQFLEEIQTAQAEAIIPVSTMIDVSESGMSGGLLESDMTSLSENVADMSADTSYVSENAAFLAENASKSSENMTNMSWDMTNMSDHMMFASESDETAENTQQTQEKQQNPEDAAVWENGLSVSENATVPENDLSMSENDLDVWGNALSVQGSDLDVSGNDLSVSGNGLSVSENDLDVSGNDLGVSGNDLSVSGNGLGVSGNDLDVSGNDLDVSGNGLGVSGNALSVSGNGLDVSGNDLSVSGNTVVSGNALSVSENALLSGNMLDILPGLVSPKISLEERRRIRSSYEETMLVNAEDIDCLAGKQFDFSGKKIVCLGDSITAAANLVGQENYPACSYPSVLQELLEAEEVVNLGIGGSTIGRYWSDPFVDRYTQIPQDTDIIIVMGGTNDGFCVSEKEFGTLAERKARTFCGDLDELMRGLRENYPNASIYFTTPLPNVLQDYLMRERPYLLPQKNLADAILTLSAYYGFSVIDLYNSNILDSHDADIVADYIPDGVHANEAGYRILAQHIAAELVRYGEGRADSLQ